MAKNSTLPELSELLGITKAGTPVFRVFGGKENDGDPEGDDDGSADGAEDDGEDGASGDDPEGEENLGDGGKSAIVKERDKAKAARAALTPWKQLSREFGTPEEIRAKLNGSTDNADVEAVRTESNKRVESMRQQVVKFGVYALASELTVDPDAAVRLLDLASFEVDENGKIDEDEVRDALTDLVDRKKYLRKTPERTRRAPAPDPSQGNPPKKVAAGSIEEGRALMRQYTKKPTKKE